MELIVEPDVYCPSIDDSGSYIDKVPAFSLIKHGVSCPCGSRKDKIYESHSSFAGHIKTKVHQKWLYDLNQNKKNYFTENEELKRTIQNQKCIIGRFEKEVNVNRMTIDILTQQIMVLKNMGTISVENLLDYD